MNDDQADPEGRSDRERPSGSSQPQSEEIQHTQASAVVPEPVSRGVFSTGAVVLNGVHEFIIDFLLRMTKPHQVAARVVLPPSVIPRFIAALRGNLENYTKRFGPPPSAPTPSDQEPTAARTSAQELYEQLKLPEDIISGKYANAVMIGHTATEFSFDFITTFFPRSAVACRVFLAAPNVPRFLDSLTHSFQEYERKLASQTPNGAPPTEHGPSSNPA